MIKKFHITWPTVALAAVLCAGFAALVKFAPPEVFAAGGIVSIVVAAGLRQMAYTKPDDGPPAPPKELP